MQPACSTPELINFFDSDIYFDCVPSISISMDGRIIGWAYHWMGVPLDGRISTVY